MIVRADVEGWILIADYIERSTGLSFGWEAARKHARKVRNPLPVYRAGRRVYARFSELDRFAAGYMRQIEALNSVGIP